MHPVTDNRLDTKQQQQYPVGATKGGAAAVVELSPQQVEMRYRLLAKPEWCPAGVQWLDDRTRRAVAMRVDEFTIRWAIAETRKARPNVKNPGGFIRSLLRNPDRVAVDSLRERMARAAAKKSVQPAGRPA
jgi:hypothetical protein